MFTAGTVVVVVVLAGCGCGGASSISGLGAVSTMPLGPVMPGVPTVRTKGPVVGVGSAVDVVGGAVVIGMVDALSPWGLTPTRPLPMSSNRVRRAYSRWWGAARQASSTLHLSPEPQAVRATQSAQGSSPATPTWGSGRTTTETVSRCDLSVAHATRATTRLPPAGVCEVSLIACM